MGPSSQTPRLTILVLCINAIIEVDLEFCLIIYSRFYFLPRFLPLKFSSLTRSPYYLSKLFLSTFNALLFIIEIPTY